MSLEEELDRLYALPLNEFTAARDELAKRLRADGERDLADEVKGLRKPTVAVWLVNQLAHEREMDVKRLLKAGEALGKAQASAKGFAEARSDEQHALERLASAAREAGVGPQAADRAIQTLRAASLTDEGRDLLKRGRLTEELEPPGFEALVGMPATKRPKAKPKPPPRKNPKLKKAQERVRKLKAEAQRAEREATAAAERLAKAEAELERLEA
ncbi:MAG TPA: hypothetical protein VIW19_02590 [Gaiellaceae bacterium]|jgi:hypothetical protein